jgi:hypothetical protein
MLNSGQLPLYLLTFHLYSILNIFVDIFFIFFKNIPIVQLNQSGFKINTPSLTENETYDKNTYRQGVTRYGACQNNLRR